MALHLLVWRAVVFGGALPLGVESDLLTAIVPYRAAAARRLLAGQWPAWEPGLLGGTPLFAGGQTGAAYPIDWLFLALPTARAVALSMVLHLGLLGVFSYGLACALRDATQRSRAPYGPLVAAFATSLGGTALAHQYAGHLGMIEAFAWMPALLWALVVVVARPGAGPAAALALAIGLEGLTGHVQTVFLTGLVAGAYLVASLGRLIGDRGRTLGRMAASVVTGFALAAPQFLPMLMLSGQTLRAHLTDPIAFSQSYSEPPLALITLVLRHPFGPPGPGFRMPFSAWETNAFVGFGVIALAAAGSVLATDRRRLLWLILSIAGGLLALGSAGPLYDLFAAIVPWVRSFRVPARFLMLPALALPLLAATGVDALQHGARSRRVAALLMCLVAVELALQAPPWMRLVQRDDRPQLSSRFVAKLRALQGSQRIAFAADGRWNVGLEFTGLRNAGGYDPAMLESIGELANLDKLRSAASSGSVEDTAYVVRLPEDTRPSRTLDLLAARWLVARHGDVRMNDPSLTFAVEGHAFAVPYDVYENRNALPRVDFAFETEVVPNAHQRLLRLADEHHDLRRPPIFEHSPPISLRTPVRFGVAARTRITRDAPETLTVAVDTPDAGYLVVRDTWAPGWRADIDGRKTELSRVDHAFRAVYVPAGLHRVTMRYEVPGLRLGVGLVLAGALALVTLWIAANRARRACALPHADLRDRRAKRPVPGKLAP